MLKEENVILLMWNIICIKFNELINICICDLEKLKLNIVKINFKKI